MNTKVMVVEDESIVALELTTFITELGYEVVGHASNADDAYKMILECEPDVVLMDVHLKGEEDGISLVSRVQKEKRVSVIYVTAYNDDESIERAIETNPAAYLAKPFNRKELAASLKIASRRFRRQSDHDIAGTLKIDEEFTYDTVNQQLLCCGEFVHLTRKELDLLVLLLDARQQVVDLYTIENRLWPEKTPNENTRRGLVSRLRSKLKHQFIKTIPGQGYRMTYKVS